VTGSISIGQQGWFWKQARELVIMSEPKLTSPFILPVDRGPQGDIPLGLMKTLFRSRFSRMPHGLQIEDEQKEIAR
jgi:hypothetical protein